MTHKRKQSALALEEEVHSKKPPCDGSQEKQGESKTNPLTKEGEPQIDSDCEDSEPEGTAEGSEEVANTETRIDTRQLRTDYHGAKYVLDLYDQLQKEEKGNYDDGGTAYEDLAKRAVRLLYTFAKALQKVQASCKKHDDLQKKFGEPIDLGEPPATDLDSYLKIEACTLGDLFSSLKSLAEKE